MKISRTIVGTAIAATVALSLTGCFGNLLGGGSTGGSTGGSSGTSTETSSVDVTGTSWSGTDSFGDFTILEFQADGTVGVTYNDQSYDDPQDTWSQSGDTVTAVIYIDSDRGNATYVGDVSGTTLDMSAETENGETWTVTLTQE